MTKVIVGRFACSRPKGGIDGFYQSRNVRGPSVLTVDVLTRAQELLNTGQWPQFVLCPL